MRIAMRLLIRLPKTIDHNQCRGTQNKQQAEPDQEVQDPHRHNLLGEVVKVKIVGHLEYNTFRTMGSRRF